MSPLQPSDTLSIGELPSLSISSSSLPLNDHHIALTDLPEDILHEIAGLLLNGYFSFDGYLRHCEVKRYEEYERDQRRKDILAVSSCCKGMRTVIFGRWFLSKLVVQLTEMELRQVETFSQELRECVRYLMILPGSSSPQDTGRLFSFIDFIRLFPNTETLWIRWVFYEEGDSHLTGLKANANANAGTSLESEQNQTEGDVALTSRATTLHLETLDPFDADYRDLDQEHIRQLHAVLQQLQFPQLRNLHLDIGHYHGLHFAGSEALWTSLIEAFALCPSPVLEDVRLDFRMVMNGRAIGFDFCATLTRVFATCWTSPAMKQIDVNLAYIGEGGDSYRFWTTSDANKGRFTKLSLELLPTSAQLVELFNAWRSARPGLKIVGIEVECQIPWDPMNKVYTPAFWFFHYPSASFADCTGTWYVIRDDDNNPTKIERLPLDDECAVIGVKDRHVHSACTYILREQEAHEQLMSIFGEAGVEHGLQRLLRAFR